MKKTHFGKRLKHYLKLLHKLKHLNKIQLKIFIVFLLKIQNQKIQRQG